jgi:hypothetical protein
MTDRVIVYTGAIPQDVDILNTNKNMMISIGMALQAILGTGTVVSGLACTPTGPASLQVLVGQGSIYAQENVDSTAYGSLSSDTAHQIVKQGINLGTKTLTLAVPGTTGQSINYLIEAAYQDTDTGSAVLPYYNASNPAVAYNGPNNTGVSQNTIRQGQCVIQAKAGVAATTGSQVTPAPDAGFTGLWVVTVNHTDTAINSGAISLYSGAPFIPYTLPNIPIRTRLTANTTFYVSTAGSDSNNGLSSTSPWLTLQHAANVIQSTYDLSGFIATISLSAGTYTGNVIVNGPFVGALGPQSVVFLGNTGSPASYISNVGSGNNFDAETGAQFTVSGMQLSGGSYALLAGSGGASISFGNIIFEAATTTHLGSGVGGTVTAIGNYTIAGGAPNHAFAGNVGAFIAINNITVTLTGTPAFSSAFANANGLSEVQVFSATFSGSATGSRYSAAANGVVNTQGAGATYLPGNASGTTATGGQYV